MNILFISTQLYPCQTGGVEIFNYYLIQSLAMTNRIWVLTSCDAHFDGAEITVVKMNPKRFISQKLSVMFEHSKVILQLRKMIDVVHIPYMSRSWLLGCYIPFLKKLCHLPYVLSLHGGAMLPWRPKLLHKILFQNADAIIAVSDIMRKEYEKRSGRKIEVIPPLIPFRKWTVLKSKTKEKYGFEKDQTIILSLGSLRKVKGSDILLNAFFLLEKEYIEKNKIRLIYVGDGILRKDLEERVQREGFGEYVKFFGNISYDKIPEIFELADIYVIASLFEGTPLSLLEAMFNGLPIIGASADGITNLISDNENGLIFEKNNEKSLMEKIKKLLEERELATQLGKRAQEKFEEYFSYEKVVEDHVQIYERIARKI